MKPLFASVPISLRTKVGGVALLTTLIAIVLSLILSTVDEARTSRSALAQARASDAELLAANLSASLAKIRLLHRTRKEHKTGVSRMVATEIEYLHSVCRSIFDSDLIPLYTFVHRAFRQKPAAVRADRGVRMIRGRACQAAQEHIAAESRNRDPGESAEPGIELLGHDVA